MARERWSSGGPAEEAATEGTHQRETLMTWPRGELRANTTSVPTAEGRRKVADEAVTANVSAPAY